MAIETQKSITFPCLRIRQPIGEFFVGVLDSKDLCEISFIDVRRRLSEDRDVERYLGIQRPLNNARVAQIQEYVKFYDSTFPTAIIVSVEGASANYSEQNRTMTLSNVLGDEIQTSVLFRNIAKVLDGQHRIMGLYDYEGPPFELNVTIFVGIDVAQQAQIFSTVNLEQTKVNKSLAYDLYALANSRSPQKTCHNVVVALDQDKDSPFYQRIKRLGTTTEGRFAETLTQATFVEALMAYISDNPKEDRDAILRGSRLLRPDKRMLERRPLRELFLREEDIEIAKIVRNYFKAVEYRWPAAWQSYQRGYMLNKTNGFRGLMKVFGRVYLRLAKPGDVPPIEDFSKLLSMSSLNDADFRVENFPPGSSGEAMLVKSLTADLNLQI